MSPAFCYRIEFILELGTEFIWLILTSPLGRLTSEMLAESLPNRSYNMISALIASNFSAAGVAEIA